MSRTDAVYALLKETHRKGQLECYPSQSDPDLQICRKHFFNGRLQFRFTLKEGRLHGPGRMWYECGQLLREDPFYKGILHGRQSQWYDSGKFKKEAFYRNNALHGRSREWYVHGQIKSECHYLMNKLDGESTEWYPNGIVKEVMPFVEGQRNGVNKEYTPNGQLLRKQLYLHDVKLTGKVQRLFESGQLKAKYIQRIQNANLRRFCLEELGYERFLRDVEHEVLDKQEDQELVKVDWHPEEEPLYLVKVRCPSTSVYYTLRVSPKVRTVQEAVAWTFGLQEKDYQPEEES